METSDALHLNRKSWDERVPIHVASKAYGADWERLRQGGYCLPPVVVDEVGDVSGKSLAHLMCHFGLDTLSWARLGAEATGLDFSSVAIETANQASAELGLPTRFVCGEVCEAVELLGQTYDVVFTSTGVLCWLPDLKRWAQAVAGLLKPGGVFYLREMHPFLDVFENTDDGSDIRIQYGYFQPQPLRFPAGPTYTDAPPGAVVGETVEWQHPVSEVINALIGVGLRLEFFRERPGCGYPKFDVMREVSPGRYDLPEPRGGKLPMMFSLRARKE